LIYESRGNEHFFYIPDFYCAAEKLVIEVDGSVHWDQVERDKHRDEILKSRGIRILRIQNQELTEIEVVLAKIKAQFAGNPPSLPEGRGLGGG
jgi:very-short-patch-repair endonuclease